MVFISYSHDSDDLCDKVLDLSNWLRSKGVDANIDQYEESPVEGWPRWTERQIREADFVLVICTDIYQKKATLQVADDVGLGTKWETTIIESALYETGAVTNKFIPVVFTSGDVKNILAPLKGQTYYNLEYNQKKEDLKNRLLGIKKNKKPPLGSEQPLAFKESKPDARMLITGVIDTPTWDKAKWKGVGYAMTFKDPPFLGLYHEYPQYSLKIFNDWITRFGHEDINEEICISIIEDDDSDSYTIHIGADFNNVIKRIQKQGLSIDNTYFLQLDRWHRMQIVDKKWLNSFKNEYKKYGFYKLVPMIMKNNQMTPVYDLFIKKKNIKFRKLSEIIDETDYDYPAIDFKDLIDSETENENNYFNIAGVAGGA